MQELLGSLDHFDYTLAFYKAAVEEGINPDNDSMERATQRYRKAQEEARALLGGHLGTSPCGR